jgi:limonene-1,2-epoxide hydrolase
MSTPDDMRDAAPAAPAAPDARAVAQAFYGAFARRDGETMANAYAPGARFTDPVFGTLEGEQVGRMWRALTKGAREFSLDFEIVAASAAEARVTWTARYVFSRSGRRVVNRVQSVLTVDGGKIVEQTDHFDLHAWAGQALGLPGKLLGGLGFFRRKLRASARASIGLS